MNLNRSEDVILAKQINRRSISGEIS